VPIYEYRCPNHGKFEERQSFSDAFLTVCPQCQAPVEKLMPTGVGIAFKGSGFYINDYQRAGETHDEGSASSSAKPAETTATPAATPSAPAFAPQNAGGATAGSAPSSAPKVTPGATEGKPAPSALSGPAASDAA